MNLTTAVIKTPWWILEEDEKEIKAVSSIGIHKEDIFLGFDTIIHRGCIEEIKVLKKQWWR